MRALKPNDRSAPRGGVSISNGVMTCDNAIGTWVAAGSYRAGEDRTDIRAAGREPVGRTGDTGGRGNKIEKICRGGGGLFHGEDGGGKGTRR